MIKERGNKIVVMSQFNINGSRGKDAGAFVSDYVSRDSATMTSTAYVPPTGQPIEQGDGVAFTLDNSHLLRRDVLESADHIQALHETGIRAIQQLVLSFDHDYLVEQKLIPEDTKIIKKGDYKGVVDDVRLRHAVRQGIQSMVDEEGYREGQMIACIQTDTRHVHVHAVVYENAKEIARKRGKEEKGVIKASSFNQLTHDVDRYLTLTKTQHTVPNARSLKQIDEQDEVRSEKPKQAVLEPVYVNQYLRILEERKREEALEKERPDGVARIDASGDVTVEQTEDIETPDEKKGYAHIDESGDVSVDIPELGKDDTNPWLYL